MSVLCLSVQGTVLIFDMHILWLKHLQVTSTLTYDINLLTSYDPVGGKAFMPLTELIGKQTGHKNKYITKPLQITLEMQSFLAVCGHTSFSKYFFCINSIFW